MSAKPIHFELVSPERKLVDAPLAHVVIPGSEGYMGVGYGHASFVASLSFGAVTLYEKSMDEKSPRKIFIAGGFADISGERCTVLAEYAANAEDLDEETLKKKLEALQEDLHLVEDEADKLKLEKSIAFVEAQLDVLS